MADLFGQSVVECFGAPRRGKNAKTRPPVHDDLVNRDFAADRPNIVWLSNITERCTDEGKLYLCAIKVTGTPLSFDREKVMKVV